MRHLAPLEEEGVVTQRLSGRTRFFRFTNTLKARAVTSKSNVLLLFIAVFSGIYRSALVLSNVFPPGSDIGLHNSLIHSIIQGGNTQFVWNYYHMGGGNSITFPGYHIFTSYIISFTGLPDYLAQAFVAIVFSSILVVVAFLLTRKVWNESVALIVAFLVGVSWFDIDMLLWAGYPNIVALALIPLAFYLLLEKSRFSRSQFVTVVSLVSAAIFLTHSLSTFVFTTIVLATLLVLVLFPKRMDARRKTVLEWIVPLIIGALLASPFLVQIAPVYLNADAAVFKGGSPEIQQLLLSTRILPTELTLPFFVGFFLYFLFSKYHHGRFFSLPTVLLVLWWLIPTALTQSSIVGLYTDYQRFLYFAILPLIILTGLCIFHGSHLLAKIADLLFSTGRKQLQTYFREKRVPRWVMRPPSNQILGGGFAIALILTVFLWMPNFFITPPKGFALQNYYQAMNTPGYEGVQWARTCTPTYSVFVADAWYGWWLGGFAQRPTISGVDPQFLTNSREFEPALLAARLLDTDYLIDNGLVQIREDGGYLGRHNPEFLVKLSNSYYPFPFLNFNNNQTTITLKKSGDLNTFKLSEIPVREMHVENSSTLVSTCVSWGNELLNFTQTSTVYQGVRFVNLTENIWSDDPTVSFDQVSFVVQTRAHIVSGNGTSIELVDPYLNVAGQMIFPEAQPSVTKTMEGQFEINFNLSTQLANEINFHASVFEYSSLGLNSATQNSLHQLFAHYTISYANIVSELPLDVFDYRRAIASLNASYIVLRDSSQIPRFAKDSLFSLVFINKEVAIFKIHNNLTSKLEIVSNAKA